MKTTISLILGIGFLALMTANIVYIFKALKERNDGVDLMDKRWQYNPFNLLAFHPYEFSEKGLRYRKIHIRITFFILFIWIVMFLVALLTGKI